MKGLRITHHNDKDYLWTRDRWTGNFICAVCGAPKENKKVCCPVAPYLSFDEFKEQYWGKEDVPYAIAKEFYEDYQLSDCTSLEDYIKDTRGGE